MLPFSIINFSGAPVKQPIVLLMLHAQTVYSVQTQSDLVQAAKKFAKHKMFIAVDESRKHC